jgi:hypothetical protein
VDLQIVINNHSKVFREIPKGLPLVRDRDHAIHLQPRSIPPNIRHYRYPYEHKSEIECMIQEMVEAGIIQPIQSSFSSQVVMVTHNDGSWCMCPYYRQLNTMTMKYKFHIPRIDELLDEFHGYILFTKLDLCLGYHQIRIKQEDIPKITFRTHEIHYEFLVMPFGLINVPSIFQISMNSIFKPFLRKIVLVFSDDIIIYNKYLEEHVKHIDRVLQLLEEKQLYTKPSECAFEIQELEYLGHNRSHEGVKVDPNKTKAMREWPIPKTLKKLKLILSIDRLFLEVFQALWSNKNTSNSIIKEGIIFLDSGSNQIL